MWTTGSLWRIQSQQSFDTLTPFYFPFHSLHVSAPTGHPQVRYTIRYLKDYFLIQRIRCTYAIWYRDVICCHRYLHLQHRQHTNHEEETSNTRHRTKNLHCPQLDHNDADGLAGQRTWRTTQTTMRRYNCAIRESVHSSWYFNILTFLTFYIWDRSQHH
jgi:hypothetical protein